MMRMEWLTYRLGYKRVEAEGETERGRTLGERMRVVP